MISKTILLRSVSCIFALTPLFCVDLPEAPVPRTVCVAPLSSVVSSASPFASWNSEGCFPTPEPFQREF
jgi:hypothetical protein